MTKQQRECAFCGGRPLTREHVLPAWLTRNEVVRFDSTTRRSDPDGNLMTLPLSPGSQTAKAFCEPCNGGWMSELESQVKPLLTPIIIGDQTRRVVGEAEQSIIGFWAAKTAVTCQFVNPRDQRHVSTQHRRQMRELQRPADGTSVWVAPHRSPAAFEARFTWTGLSIHASDAVPADDEWTSFAATLGLGKLLIVVVHLEPGDLTENLQTDWGKFAHRLSRIWPTTSSPLSWPPSGPALSETECVQITNAFKTVPITDGTVRPQAT